MVTVEGIVSSCGMRKGSDGKQYMNFAVEGWNLILDGQVDPTTLPDVGTKVRAIVNRVWSSEKKREYFFVLGFLPFSKSPAVNGHVPESE